MDAKHETFLKEEKARIEQELEGASAQEREDFFCQIDEWCYLKYEEALIEQE